MSLQVIANLAIVLTIFSQLTGSAISYRIQKVRSTKDFTALPFIVGVLCAFLWTQYGLLLNDQVMIFINAFGFCVHSTYLAHFYYFTSNRKQLNRRLLAVLVFLAFVDFYIRYSSSPNNLVGTLACLGSLLFCSSPLALVSEVIRDKCTAKLPFGLIASSFGVTILWFAYGFLIRDPFVQIPNAIGAIISGVQLSLFLIYPSKAAQKDLPYTSLPREVEDFFDVQDLYDVQEEEDRFALGVDQDIFI